ncbi:hypothetical protein MASR2M47_35040 [Draconibacterium sp.]
MILAGIGIVKLLPKKEINTYQIETKIDLIIEDKTFQEFNSSQDSINENANELNFRFFDELTGYAVIPEYVEIKRREDGKSHRSISNGQISKNGTVIKRVANGAYDISVSAIGYLPMKTFFDLNDQTLNINFNLVPINPLNELTDLYIQSLHQPGMMVIVGCIVDDLTGKPLKKVQIYTSDKIVTTYSNEKGYFHLRIPLPEVEQQVELRGTIYFKLNNYITEVRQKFDMWSNGDAIFQIRMITGSGLNTISILENRLPSREIITKGRTP